MGFLMSSTSTISGSGNATLGSDIQIAVAVKARDVVKAQGQAALSLLDSAVQFQRETTGSQAPVSPGRLDVKA